LRPPQAQPLPYNDPSGLAAFGGGEIVTLPDSVGVIFPEGDGWTWDDELFPHGTPSREVVVEAESNKDFVRFHVNGEA